MSELNIILNELDDIYEALKALVYIGLGLGALISDCLIIIAAKR